MPAPSETIAAAWFDVDVSRTLDGVPVMGERPYVCRALHVLRTADIIFCEDCRHTRKLLSHFEISTALESLHQHNETRKSSRLVSFLQQGQAVALVSDAGTPGISDPGSITVTQAIAAGYDVVPIPGPCAVRVLYVLAVLKEHATQLYSTIRAQAEARKYLAYGVLTVTESQVHVQLKWQTAASIPIFHGCRLCQA